MNEGASERASKRASKQASKGASLVQPLQKNRLGNQQPSSHSDAIPTGVLVRSYEDSSSRHWCPGWGAGFGARIPHFLGGSSAAQIAVQILNHHRGRGTSLFGIPAPLPVLWLLYILGYQTSAQLTFRRFSMMVAP